MSALREEIIESQKVRSELLKWKLLIVSALGAAGLGLSGQEASGHGAVSSAYLVLLLIPFACFYVDLLCRHMSLRIIVIGTFLRNSSSDEETEYERFVLKTKSMGPKKLNVFDLEDWALGGSTTVLSLLVILAGLILPGIRKPEDQTITIWGASVDMSQVVPWIFFGVGLAGLILNWMARWHYKRRIDALGDLEKKMKLAQALGVIVASNVPYR